ncbi:inactive serine/threonine-protein kinase 19-like [Sycon ciliatum]|uniref:inactive serine/threonine-protein kinase 19-like n=1 Tax=Sycon ciliatum TaxID=27933 RepID=UPI0020AE9415|eukprot:scpid94065/ scgid29625/ Serine/threonine-protein kinase 19; Protein G11; Protein RP1
MKRSLPPQVASETSEAVAKKARSIDEDSGLDDADLLAAVPSETEAAIQLVSARFPSAGVLGGAMPPLALKHQLYAVVNDRTLVDRQLVDLSQRGVVQQFHLTTGLDEYAVVFQSDYKRHVQGCCVSTDTESDIGKLVDSLLEGVHGDVTVSKELLKERLEFSESDVTLLVSSGVLVMCNVNAWYLAIPNASVFVKALTKGRQLILRSIRQQRHKEILQLELEQRRISGIRLGILYHIYDIKGGDYVTSVSTTSGDLLRLVEDKKKTRR